MLKLENPLYVWGKFAIGSLRGTSMQALILIPFDHNPDPDPTDVASILNEFLPDCDAFPIVDDDQPWQILLCRANYEPSSDHSSGKLSFQSIRPGVVMQWPSHVSTFYIFPSQHRSKNNLFS